MAKIGDWELTERDIEVAKAMSEEEWKEEWNNGYTSLLYDFFLSTGVAPRFEATWDVKIGDVIVRNIVACNPEEAMDRAVKQQYGEDTQWEGHRGWLGRVVRKKDDDSYELVTGPERIYNCTIRSPMHEALWWVTVDGKTAKVLAKFDFEAVQRGLVQLYGPEVFWDGDFRTGSVMRHRPPDSPELVAAYVKLKLKLIMP